MNVEKIHNRLKNIEQSTGLIELPDGKYIQSKQLVIFYVDRERLRGKLGRDPQPSDFSAEDQELIRSLALWHPDHVGAIARYVCDEARKIAASV